MERQPAWTSLRRRALLDQQLWFLGKDIGAKSGNALLRYGFERRRPEHGNGSTAYLLPLNHDSDIHDGAVLICWGFAVYAGAISTGADCPHPAPYAGICLERFGNTPRLLADPLRATVHQYADLPRTIAPTTASDWATATTLMSRIARTCSSYESWAIGTRGEAHRLAALRDAPRHKRLRFTPLPSLTSVWNTFFF
jgi:hypothetical protein